jgi:hypothetical protein
VQQANCYRSEAVRYSPTVLCSTEAAAEALQQSAVESTMFQLQALSATAVLVLLLLLMVLVRYQLMSTPPAAVPGRPGSALAFHLYLRSRYF